MRYGWRTSFYIFGLVGVGWAIVWFSWFRNTPREKRGVSASELREIFAGAPGTGVAMECCHAQRKLLGDLAHGVLLGLWLLFLFHLVSYLFRARGFTEKELLLGTFLFLFGACSNVSSGVTSDFLVKRARLKAARCRIGMAGFACAALFALLAEVTPSMLGTFFLLYMSYSGICFTQPMMFPACIEVARKFPGSMAGAQNTTNQVGSFFSGALFGYIAKTSGSYDRPLLLLVLVLAVGTLSWLPMNPWGRRETPSN